MADEKVKTTRVYREYNTTKKGADVKFYDSVDDAIQDTSPQLDKIVYQANIKVLGEIKLALVPIADGSNPDAVKAVVTLAKPVDGPKGKKK